MRNGMLTEVDRLVEVDSVLLPAGSRYLLEIDFSPLNTDDLEKQSYWVLAMKAAVNVGQRMVAQSCHCTAH